MAEGHRRVHPAAQQHLLVVLELPVALVQEESGHDDDVGRRQDPGAGDPAFLPHEVDGEPEGLLSGLPGLLQRDFVDCRPDQLDVPGAGAGEQTHQAEDGFPVEGEVAVAQVLVEGVHGRQAVRPAGCDGAVDEVALGEPTAALVEPGEEFGDLLVVVRLIGDHGDLLAADVVHLLQPLHPPAEVRVGILDSGFLEDLVVLHVLLQQNRR